MLKIPPSQRIHWNTCCRNSIVPERQNLQSRETSEASVHKTSDPVVGQVQMCRVLWDWNLGNRLNSCIWLSKGSSCCLTQNNVCTLNQYDQYHTLTRLVNSKFFKIHFDWFVGPTPTVPILALTCVTENTPTDDTACKLVRAGKRVPHVYWDRNQSSMTNVYVRICRSEKYHSEGFDLKCLKWYTWEKASSRKLRERDKQLFHSHHVLWALSKTCFSK